MILAGNKQQHKEKHKKKRREKKQKMHRKGKQIIEKQRKNVDQLSLQEVPHLQDFYTKSSGIIY
jgi:hypothetical protein